jgi:hypothetical protein
LPGREIRAAALALKPTLRPGVSLKQYQVDIDCLLAHYRPKTYTPKPTRYLGAAGDLAIAPPPRRPRGRRYQPEQQRPAQLAEVRRILAAPPADDFGRIGIRTSALAAQLGKTDRMVRNYISELEQKAEIKTGKIGRARYIVLTATFGAPMPQIDQPTAGELRKLIPITIDLPEGPVLPVETPQTAIDAPAPSGETAIPNEETEKGVYSQDRARPVSATCSADNARTCSELDDDAPSAWVQRAELESWVTDAFACYPGRASFRKVEKHVHMLADGRRVNRRPL